MNPENDPIASFAFDLRRLRAQADNPSFREMNKRSNFSYAALSRAASGRGGLPTWPAVEAFVRACGGDPDDWRPRWQIVRDTLASAPPVAPVEAWEQEATLNVFVDKLQQLKVSHGDLSYREIAAKSGLSLSTVADVFNPPPTNVPSWDALRRVVLAYGVPATELDTWQETLRRATVRVSHRQNGGSSATKIQRQAVELGLEGIYPTRAEALKVFAEAIDRELEFASQAGDEDQSRGRLWICGSSMKGLIQVAIGPFDGSELIQKVVATKCDLRLLCTHPRHAEVRAEQEHRMKGEIEKEILLSLSHFKQRGVSRDKVKYHKNMPNVFAICTSEKMLLNPYPHGGEAFRDFTLIVHRTPSPDSIFDRYVRRHFEAAWNSADSIPVAHWGRESK